MPVNILDVRVTPDMSIQEAVYIRSAVKAYCKGLKNGDEKEVLLLWLRQLDNYLSDKSIISNLPESF